MTLKNFVIYLLLHSTLFFQNNSYENLDRSTLSRNPQINKLIENNNGVPVPPGYYSHVVIFVKKPNFNEDYESNPTDFSIKSAVFSSGTLLNRRWALTRATPIAYYSIGSYWMVSQQSIILPIDSGYEIDTVLIHPDHQPGILTTDLALVRSAEILKFTFETRNVKLGPINTPPAEASNCKMVVWSWLNWTDVEKNAESIDKGEIDLVLVPDNCNNEYFLCFVPKDKSRQPCAINSGMPIICDAILAGVYVGNGGDATCTNKDNPGNLNAIRVNTLFFRGWFLEALHDDKLDTDEQDPELRVCGGGSTGYQLSMCFVVIITVFI